MAVVSCEYKPNLLPIMVDCCKWKFVEADVSQMWKGDFIYCIIGTGAIWAALVCDAKLNQIPLK